MKRVAIIMAVLVIAVVALLTLLARREQPVNYNPGTETRISGTVQDVQEYFCPVANDRGTHLVLRTDQGDMLIHVGVGRFLRRQSIAFAAGDKLEVLGSRIKPEALIARQVTRGNDVFILRDMTGKPLWQ